MIGIEGKFSSGPDRSSLQGNDSHSKLLELQAENARLQRIVSELLIRNQQLREQASSTTESDTSA
jgi:hypothetical protein